MLKPKNKILNFFSYIGYPFYRVLLVVTISLTIVSSLTKKTLYSIKLPRVKISKLKIPKINFFSGNNILKQLSLPKIIILTVVSFTAFFCYKFYQSLPDAKIIGNYPSKLSTKILDRNGKLLYQIYKDENRTRIHIEELPSHIKNAFLSAEDKDFYRHHGFSISGLSRAVFRNLFNNKIEGGSTITQQLVKNTLLTNEKTFSRKIKELILSVRVEILYSKDKIFETYLNQVGFGGPAYGIEEASQQYFGIHAKDLSIAQASYLAGLTRAPSKYSPFGDNPELGLQRQKTVINQLLKNKLINQQEYDQANSEVIEFKSSKNEIIAPHFVMFVKNILVDQLGENVVNQGGLTVYTTLDLEIQKMAQGIVSKEIKGLKNMNVTNGAALITNPKTGEILAMVGSKDYFNLQEMGQVNLTTSLRQPGSSIKPLNYALALERGKKITDTIEDKPISITYPGRETWSPKNYDNKFHGTVTLRQALANSYNIPSVLILKENGILDFVKFAQKIGITSWDDPSRYGLSMGLGSLEVKMTDMATAYSTFANNGLTTPLVSIIKIESSNKNLKYISQCQELSPHDTSYEVLANEDICLSRRTIKAETATAITDILSDNQARSSAFGFNSVLNIKGSKVAVKTGTSNELKDNWAIGYTSNFLVATWVGNNDSKPMSHIASGITGASPIWSKIFTDLINQNNKNLTHQSL